MTTERETIEIFHLLFLRAFGARVDKALYVLKGGCNLRFFHKSIRYSEDMDIDVRTLAVPTLRNNVDRVLEAPSFAATLRAHQLQIAQISRPKQTETTQRWKIGLLTGPAQSTVPTKIEFSRRSLDPMHPLESVDPELIRRYRLYPVLTQHYAAHSAFEQKIAALALRSTTQARDVFDLKLLLDAGGGSDPVSADTAVRLEAAVENAMTIGYDAFAGQVLAFLDPDHQRHYRTRVAWETLQAEVVDALVALRT